MSKKYLPAILTLIMITVSTLMWEKIVLPYDTQNEIYGEYSINLYNPNNDTLRFIIYIFLPLITFFISYLILYKEETFSISEVLFNNSTTLKTEKFINLNLLITFIIIIFITFGLKFIK